MNSSSSSHCPKCGAEIPAGAPQGVCPRCLMQQAMQPTVVLSDPPVAPPDAEIVSAFPQFQILEIIGVGGMGRVYKVRQPHLDRVAALKILPRELAADPAFAERFMREGRALAKLSHPNIVGVFDFGKSGDFHWLLMEYVDGVNLRQAMHAGAMNPRETLHIIPAICAALEYAHSQGVLHRDIKPENILIDTAGRVKIADFGVAKLSGEAGRRVTLTLSGSALGTPAYMAPEQIERPQDVDHRADIYSLGVVFYEMLTGELPLGRFPAPSETAGIDPRLDTVVFRTLEKQRERRYQSAGEMKTQVENVASSPPLPIVPPVPHLPRRAPERMSRKAVWGLVMVLAGMLILLAALPVSYMGTRVETLQRSAEEAEEAEEAERNAARTLEGERRTPETAPPREDDIKELEELLKNNKPALEEELSKLKERARERLKKESPPGSPDTSHPPKPTVEGEPPATAPAPR